jgi:hypothetical protein
MAGVGASQVSAGPGAQHRAAASPRWGWEPSDQEHFSATLVQAVGLLHVWVNFQESAVIS